MARSDLEGTAPARNTEPEVDEALLRSLLVLAEIIEARDPYTGGHLWRVSQFAKLLAFKIGLPEREVLRISLAAYLHDLGKVGIPDHILCKEGELNDEEYAVVRTHPSVGGRLLESHPLGDLVYKVALEHHERVDGRGYPRGLRGEQISLASRIVSVADAFDAMTSTRPYRRGLSTEEALRRLEEGAGTQFDAGIVAHMRALGLAGDLDHIVGHTAPGIPAVPCPQCGAVLSLPRGAIEGEIVYCRACRGAVSLTRHGETVSTKLVGQTDDPRLLEPQPNHAGVDDVMSQSEILWETKDS
ncbi:MAG: HD domain-containing protein [Anaerolineae bacterium]|nr:MAG: HD domain-containing protein [Anaerolineae bacterium]